MDPRATLETIGGKAVLRFERRLAHPPEKVFRAISEPAELAHWFPAKVETELRAGAPIRFEFEDVDFEAPPGEMLEVDPPKLLAYAWGDGVLRWEVVPEGAGCRLHFTHTLGGGDAWGGRLAAARQAAGWDVCLAALEARLAGTAGGELDWFPRQEAYVERFGLAEGEVRAHADGHEARFERDLVKRANEVWAALTGGDDPGPGGPVPRLVHRRPRPARRAARGRASARARVRVAARRRAGRPRALGAARARIRLAAGRQPDGAGRWRACCRRRLRAGRPTWSC